MHTPMQTITHSRYGPPEVLHLIRVPRPAPGPREVLIQIHATTVTTAECNMRKGQPHWGRLILGLWRPRRSMRIQGLELAGTIAAVGSAITRFKPGDRVFGFTGFRMRGCAEYVCLPEDAALVPMPAGLSFAEAAAVVDGASTALFFLRKVGLTAGQRILINGASGGIGVYAVQLAHHLGAHVTGVCSGGNAQLVRDLGADTVIDYTQADFTQGSGRYAIVFDAVGKSSFQHARRVLTPNGRYVATNIGPHILAQLLWTRLHRGQRVVSGMSIHKTAELTFLSTLLENGTLRPIIGRRYPLEAVVEAHHYVETGHKTGNVVIEIIAEDR